MIHSVLGSRYGITGVLGSARQREAAPSGGWWLTGGIPAVNCIGAYQAKGVASLAASYSNLANPGTYDAALGVAPAWDDVNGWKFDGIDDYLNTGITPEHDQTWSMIIRHSNWVRVQNFSTLAGCGDGAGHGFLLDERDAVAPFVGREVYFFNGGYSLIVEDPYTAGVWCVAGSDGYIDGVDVVDIINNTSDWQGEVYIAAQNNSGNPYTFSDIDIQALAIYDIDIAAYVAGLTTAMAAL